MKQNFQNEANVRGYVFEHSLEARVTGSDSRNPGVNFITGAIQVAVDEDCTNVVPVHFSFVPEKFNNGRENATYTNLKQLIGENNTVNRVGKQNAARVRISGNIEINDFYTRDDELVSAQRLRGSFCHFLNVTEPLEGGAIFKGDMLITFAGEQEYPTTGDTHYALMGFMFDWNKAVLPVNFDATTKEGEKFFESQDITPSTPYFGTVWGSINSTTVEQAAQEPVENIGFGAPVVSEARTFTSRVWGVEGATMPLELDETTVTAEDVQKALQDRETYLAEQKARAAAYRARQENGASTAFGGPKVEKTSPTKDFDFKF